MTQENMIDADTKTLVEMLCTRRPAFSKSERRFIRKYLSPLGMEIDDFGNLSKRIGRAPVLWSCHTDTVHRKGGHQKIEIGRNDKGVNIARIHPNADSNCLGADDTAGIWLMREMILANVPGLYIFHRAEEVGGLGSSYIAKETPNALCGIKYAIALDRRGTDSVITYQGYGRGCSDAFARALAQGIGHGFYPDNTGIFTDTANYMDIVPECTNLSVGYDHEHTARETLNLDHLFRLRKSLINLDVTGLPVERDPTKREYDYDDAIHWFSDADQEPHSGATMSQAVAIIQQNPEHAAELLRAYGLSNSDIIDEMQGLGAALPH